MNLAARAGNDPTSPDSESGVLPLNERAMVPVEGLEPPRPKAAAFETAASASSTTQV